MVGDQSHKKQKSHNCSFSRLFSASEGLVYLVCALFYVYFYMFIGKNKERK